MDVTSGVLTLMDKGGSPDLQGKTVMVDVGSGTKITRDDASATFAQIQVGDEVTANGTSSTGAIKAAHVSNSAQAPP